MSEWEYKNYRDRKLSLEQQGYLFKITADGYDVYRNGVFVYGPGVKLPRENPLHHSHAKANMRDNLQAAVISAERHLSINQLYQAPAQPLTAP